MRGVCVHRNITDFKDGPGAEKYWQLSLMFDSEESSFRPRERNEIDDMIDRFHSDRKVQELCCVIRQTAAAELLVKHNSVTYGREYSARQSIPDKTALAFCTGTPETETHFIRHHACGPELLIESGIFTFDS